MWLDVACALVLLLGIWKGWKDGLLASVFAALAWLIGIVGGLQLTAEATQLLRQRFNLQSELTPVVAFVLVFVLVAIAVYLAGKLLERFVQLAQLGWLNRLLGVVLRSVVYLFLLSIGVWLIHQAGLLTPEFKVRSHTFQPLLLMADAGLAMLQAWLPSLRAALQDLQQFFETIDDSLIS
ncbi:MAG: CvpA family protein [Chitinophagales bacterium]|nr:CvpA family protein [Chitinophagales bacterium]MDW8392929.1 CvpA family protein [Chitinophagales bacterium]